MTQLYNTLVIAANGNNVVHVYNEIDTSLGTMMIKQRKISITLNDFKLMDDDTLKMPTLSDFKLMDGTLKMPKPCTG